MPKRRREKRDETSKWKREATSRFGVRRKMRKFAHDIRKMILTRGKYVFGFDLGLRYSGTICQRHNIINGMNQTHQLPYAQHSHMHTLKSIKLFAAYQSDESDGIKFGFFRLSVRQSVRFFLFSHPLLVLHVPPFTMKCALTCSHKHPMLRVNRMK